MSAAGRAASGRDSGRWRSRSLGQVVGEVLRKRRRISRAAPRLQRPRDTDTGVDTRLKRGGGNLVDHDGFQQWVDTCRPIVWLPAGIPSAWRQRMWVMMADHYLDTIAVDWGKTVERVMAGLDQDVLGVRVEKDLRQSSLKQYGGADLKRFLAALKRLLVAYARWNQHTGYCQGFITPAAVILAAMGSDEGAALKVLLYLLDHVLPDSYFANSISALTVDVTVFHELLKIQLPDLWQHLEHLYRAAKQASDGRCVLPLHSVVTMHWLLTLFTSCLPKDSVIWIFDAIFFEGSEVMLRVALAIWAQLAEWIGRCQSIEEVSFGLSREMMARKVLEPVGLMQAVRSMAAFPSLKVRELREKYSRGPPQTKPSVASVRPNDPSLRKTGSETNGHCTFLAAVGYAQTQNQHNTGSSDSQSGTTLPYPSKTKNMNRFLADQRLENGTKARGNGGHQLGETSETGHKEQRKRLLAPWCLQVSRRTLCRGSKGRSACSDTVSLLQETNDVYKADPPKTADSARPPPEGSWENPGTSWDRDGKRSEPWWERDGGGPSAVETLLQTLHISEQRPGPSPAPRTSPRR
ncbi:TBC1 domain family member 30-like [Leucoraja erinacea]|uniref:TBC1 domain family member 30-like n=1 Tax=Leucoraja erinaceus TaxID=7782 RepID=UPI0024576B7E|nr:TBC1 domain family member 30-like [Leucoraja erinacea]